MLERRSGELQFLHSHVGILVLEEKSNFFFLSYHFFIFSCVYYICVVAFLKEVLSWRVQACSKIMGEEMMKMWNN